MRRGDQQIAGDRGRDDARDDRQVGVGVGVAREATGVVAGAERDRARARSSRRSTATTAPRSRRTRRRGRARPSRSSPAADAVAPVTTIDSPSAMMMKTWQRSAKCAALDVVVGRDGAAATRQPVAGRGRGELERERGDPQDEPLVAVERRAGQPQHAGRGAPDDEPLEHVAQPVAAVQQRRRGGVAADLERDVARREQQRPLTERLGQRGGHEQAAEHHRRQHRRGPAGRPGRTSWPSRSCRSTPTRRRAAGRRRARRRRRRGRRGSGATAA